MAAWHTAGVLVTQSRHSITSTLQLWFHDISSEHLAISVAGPMNFYALSGQLTDPSVNTATFT